MPALTRQQRNEREYAFKARYEAMSDIEYIRYMNEGYDESYIQDRITKFLAAKKRIQEHEEWIRKRDKK